MKNRKEEKAAGKKGKVNESDKSLALETLPAALPLFPFGTFLLPLFIPVPIQSPHQKK